MRHKSELGEIESCYLQCLSVNDAAAKLGQSAHYVQLAYEMFDRKWPALAKSRLDKSAKTR